MQPQTWDADRQAQAAMLGAEVVYLADVDLSPEAAEVRKRMVAKYGKKVGDFRGSVPMDDFKRQSYVAGLIGGGSLLDVGCAHGVFANIATLSGRFGCVVGVDIADYGLYMNVGWDRVVADATALPFDAGEFDTVTAQEIIEHLPDDKMIKALIEFMRVGKSVLVSVPFCEWPIGRSHCQSFNAERLAGMFPDGRFTILVKARQGTPWVVIENVK